MQCWAQPLSLGFTIVFIQIAIQEEMRGSERARKTFSPQPKQCPPPRLHSWFEVLQTPDPVPHRAHDNLYVWCVGSQTDEGYLSKPSYPVPHLLTNCMAESHQFHATMYLSRVLNGLSSGKASRNQGAYHIGKSVLIDSFLL